jgi:hypothetical protein
VADKILDCSKVPSESGCTLRIAGKESEVLDAGVAHAVRVHGHEDTPELHDQIRTGLSDVEEPGFVQMIDVRVDDIGAVDALEQEWLAATEGSRRTIRSVTCADRDHPGRYVVLVEFPSYEAAQANNDLPATGHFAEQLRKLVTDGPTFRNLDVVRIEA